MRSPLKARDGFLVPPKREGIPTNVRVLFYLFVATIPLESIDLVAHFSVPQILGLCFGGAVLVQARTFLRRPPTALWFLLSYFCLEAVRVAWIEPSLMDYWQMRVIQLAQLALLFWFSYSLFKEPRVIQTAFGCFTASCAVAAAGLQLELPGFVSPESRYIFEDRASPFNNDPNVFSAMLGVAALCVGAMLVRRYGRTHRISLPLTLLLGYFLVEIVVTQSRGGLLAFAAGGVAMVWSVPQGKRRFLRYTLVAFGMAVIVGTIMRTPEAESRWEETIQQGNMAGRERIYPAAINMIKEKPLFGWGLQENIFVLGAMTGKERRDTHNSFLWIATELGLTAALPFAIGVFLCGLPAWRGRRGPMGNFPLGMFVAAISMNMSVTMLFMKITWVLLALAAGAEAIGPTGAEAQDKIPSKVTLFRGLAGRTPTRLQGK